MRAKLLISNFFFFGVLRVVSSIIPFVILPIITRYLNDPKDFGVYDNYTIAVSILCSISMLGSYDAMFREYFIQKDEHHRNNVVKTGFAIVLLVSLLMACCSYLFRTTLSGIFFGENGLASIFIFVALTIPIQTMNNISISPSRMNNNKKHILFHTLLYSISFYSLSLLFLEGGLSYLGLIFAQIISHLLCFLTFISINRKYFIFGNYSSKIRNSLLRVGLPLVPIFIIYWANNAMARIFIVNGIGDKELGVFALASRYAAVSSLLQAAFSGGWSFFTFSTMKDSDQVEMKSKVFKYLSAIIPIFCIGLSFVHVAFFQYFFEGIYQKASDIIIFLFVAPLFLILYQIIANQFTIIGKSYMNLIALISGLILNISVCYYGAFVMKNLKITSISIGLGYYLSVMFIILLGSKFKVFIYDRTILLNLLLTGIFIFLVFISPPYLFLLSVFILVVLIFNNRKIFKQSIDQIKGILTKRSHAEPV